MAKLERLFAGAIAIAVCTAPSLAKHKTAAPQVGAPAHNFVGMDLTASIPDAPSPRHMDVKLIDTVTAKRSGDTVTFDVLTISKSFGHYMSGTREVGPPEGTIMHGISTYAASCNWRTIRFVSVTPSFYGVGQQMPIRLTSASLQNTFLEPASPYLTVIDRLCSNAPLNAVKGFAGADAAVAAWVGAFAADPNGPPAPPVMRPAPTAYAASGVDSTKPHKFVQIETDAITGNARYLDRGTLVRDGKNVTALSFSLLGPEARIWSNGNVGVLQTISYDCAANTMTVLQQLAYDRFQTLRGTAKISFAPRSVDATAQIAAACAPGNDDQGLSSIDAVWAAMLAQLPPHPLSGWVACLWNNLPAERRQAFTDHWTGDANDRFFVQQADVPAVFAGCNIPDTHRDDALQRVPQYATQRGALARLATRKLDEAALIGAWRALPNPDRLRVIRALHTLNVDDVTFEIAVLNKLVTQLGLSASDADGRNWAKSYFMDEMALEGA